MIPQSYRSKQLVHSWTYNAMDGAPLGVVGRYEDNGGKKDVVPFFNWDNGTLKAGITLNPRPLFGLEKLTIRAKEKVVFIVEGEKCAAALGYLNCCAVTSIGGAQAGKKADWSALNSFKRVIILPDNDEQGIKYATEVQGILLTLTEPPIVEIKQIAGLPPKGDIIDWLQCHLPEWDGYSAIDFQHVENLRKTLWQALENAEMVPLNIPINSQSIDVIPWPDPQEINPSVLAEPYPIDSLPDAIRLAVEEVTEFVQAPVSLVACSALASVSLALQTHIDVKRAEKLEGPTGLYFLVVAASGERKSTCDQFFMKPIKDYQQKQFQEKEHLLRDYESKKDIWEAKYNATKEKIKQLSKKQSATESQELALKNLQAQKPKLPKIERLIYADFTPEALAHGLAEKWPSAGVISSEAGTVFGSHGMSKDSVMRNLALLNQLWDGASINVDRKTSDSFMIRGARLTVALQIQKEPLFEFFRQSGTLARGTGFLARFLVAYPESTQGKRLFREAPQCWPYLGVFCNKIAEILALKSPMNEDGFLSPTMVYFSKEAKLLWIEFHDEIEKMIGKEGELFDIQDVASKAADNAARLAALFQSFEYGIGTEICADSFLKASRIVSWHLNESLRFFKSSSVSKELSDVMKLDSCLLNHCENTGMAIIPKNDVLQCGPLRKLELLEPCLKELIRLERVRVQKDGKTTFIQINPKLCEKSNEP